MKYDAIVVGSGASGGWAAKELSERGLHVLVLEAGRAIDPEADFPAAVRWTNPRVPWPRMEAALRGQHIQARCPNWSRPMRHFFVNDRENPYSQEPGSRFLWFRGRQEGGRLHAWGRISPRMADLELAAPSLDGHGPDWPIRYADLAPWYDRVEGFLGLYGEPDGIGHLPDGRYLGPRPMTAREAAFKRAVEAAWPERRVVGARIMRQASRVPPALEAARATGRCDFRADAVVARIEVDDASGRARGVTFTDRLGRTSQTVLARLVVLCASTIESVRLLLNSAGPAHPRGLANRSGQLGLGIMDNTYVFFAGNTDGFEPMPEDVDAYDFSRGVGFLMPQFRNVVRRDAPFRRGYAVCGGIGRGGSSWWIGSFGSMLRYEENRVTIDAGRTDAWGIPVARIRCVHGENERQMLEDQIRSLREMMAAAGLVESGMGRNALERLVSRSLRFAYGAADNVLFPGAAIHECGGAVMGTDPARSVLDPFNQAWDVPGLFVTDASCFPTCPAVNLTNTIMALTARACDHAAGLLERGEL
jgi:choline dehydrogenase-like flavoprotein